MKTRRALRAAFRRRHPVLFRCGVGLVAGVLSYSGYAALKWSREVNSFRHAETRPPYRLPAEARDSYAKMIQYAAFRAEWTSNQLDKGHPVLVLTSATLHQAFPNYQFLQVNGAGWLPTSSIWAVSTTGGEPWCFDSATVVGDFLAEAGYVVANNANADELNKILYEILPGAWRYCDLDGDNEQIDDFQWRIGVKQAEQPRGQTFFEVNLDERGAVECGTIVFKPATIDDRITPAKARPTPPHPATPPAAREPATPTKLPK